MSASSPSAPSPASPQGSTDALAWATINTIRGLAMDAVERANSGHPGTPMALAPVGYLLWSKFLKHNPDDPAWVDRDRFVLSCGHASMLLYSLLHLTGYDLSLEDIRHFRQWGSPTAGHPERGHAPGIEVTTGPLGQGVGNSVGMAIAERFLAARFNRPEFPIVDHRTWAFVSDGDLMEGVASEAASLAGHLRLGKLCCVYDDNHITIDGTTELSFSEDVHKRFSGYDWKVIRVSSGTDLKAIQRALAAARRETDRPTLIILRTIIGEPAPHKQNTSAAHGSPLGAAEVKATKQVMGWPDTPFYVPPEVDAQRARFARRGRREERAWRKLFDAYAAQYPVDAAEFDAWMQGGLPAGWDAGLPDFAGQSGLATRQASQAVLDAIARTIPNLIGGAADLAHSTGSNIKDGGDFSATTTGRNLHFGIREHAMTASLNGMAAHGGVRPFGATFLIFSDYLKPSIRLSALMKLPVILLGTHDSIGVGEDGPTHQPIEQLATLRATPNVHVLRPADAAETTECWRMALERTDGPSVLALTRQKLPILDRTRLRPAADARRGGYVLFEPPTAPVAIVMATGSEVQLALAAAEQLTGAGTPTRAVSLPCWEVFEAQPQEYRDSVLPPGVTARVSVEAASTFGWSRFVGLEGVAVGLDHFGASAPAETLFHEFGITTDHVVAAVRQSLGRRTA
ncbi:MAG TPA: transketolase [Gemmatimonadales bacterium]|nr:transketolase [Gemmatimonadales bacterium]